MSGSLSITRVTDVKNLTECLTDSSTINVMMTIYIKRFGRCKQMIVTMLLGFLTCVVALLGSELIGYLYHRLAHAPGTALYRAHMAHHLDAYPHTDFMSVERYRSTGTSSFVLWFVPIFIVFVGLEFLLLPLWLFWFALAATSVSALLNVYVHDAVHVHGMSLDSGWFKWARLRHYVHHRNMRKNFCIWMFLWDRVFGTLKEPELTAR